MITIRGSKARGSPRPSGSMTTRRISGGYQRCACVLKGILGSQSSLAVMHSPSLPCKRITSVKLEEMTSLVSGRRDSESDALSKK